MRVGIAAGEDTNELWKWLERERDLRPYLKAVPGSLAGDAMGAEEYVIAAAVTALPIVARSVCNYLAVRVKHRGATLSLRVTNESGRVTEIKVDRAGDPEGLTRLLLDAAGSTDGKPDATTDS